jgi:hypothetical protein
VVLAIPPADVVALVGFKVPQSTPPEVLKVTTSPATSAPAAFFTFAAMAEVEAPSPGTCDGIAVTATLFTAVCVMVVEPVRPESASVTVTVQAPGVADDV